MGSPSHDGAGFGPQDALPRLEDFTHSLWQWFEAMQREWAERLARERAEQARRGLTIASEAMQQIGSSVWAKDAAKDQYPAGTNKCNVFVYDMLSAAGTPVPVFERLSAADSIGQVLPIHKWYPPLAGEWANPKHDIPGWIVVKDPQPGDVAAVRHDSNDASGHTAIVVPGGMTVYASARSGKVEMSDWGFRSDQKGDVVFRRYVGIQQ